MAIAKLVCQGCGANLDAVAEQRMLRCTYCGTTNQIKQTVHQQPAPSFQQALQPQLERVRAAQASAGKGVLAIVLIGALFPIVIGGVVMCAAMTGIDAISESGLNGDPARKYRWTSEKPFVADVDGDGTEDLVGLTQAMGSSDVRLTAVSGRDFNSLWETSLGELGNIAGRPAIRFDGAHGLVLFASGTALTAYEAKTGSQRWISSFSDAVEAITVDGELLRVWTIDKKQAVVRSVDGKPTAASEQPSASALLLRDDEGYELIPELRTLDLDYDRFPGLRVQAGFCPEHDLPFSLDFRYDASLLACRFPHGLAWASRAEGTAVPFLVGYERASKAERWRVQLTTPGTLETVDTGFSQPRAELEGDHAVVSFIPMDDHPRIRRLSLIDGATVWEAKIAPKSGASVTGIIVGEQRVFVRYGEVVHVFALADGASVTVLGDW